MFGPEVLIACVPQAAFIAANFGTVFTMQAILNFLATPESSQSFTPGGLIAATALCSLTLMVCIVLYVDIQY